MFCFPFNTEGNLFLIVASPAEYFQDFLEFLTPPFPKSQTFYLTWQNVAGNH